MPAYESLWRIRWHIFLDWLAKHQQTALEDVKNAVSQVVEPIKLRVKPARESFQISVSNLWGYIQSQNLADLLKKFDASISTSNFVHFGCRT